MALHVIVGAGPVGSGTASLLADAGHEVRIVTRHGTGPDRPGIERVAADASLAGELRGLVSGAVAIYNCANPPYHRWATDWPPLAAALLDAAEQSGAVLVTTSNLYGYGPVDHPMTESDPLEAAFTNGRVRAQMWNDALEAHRQGRVRVTEARAADYFGPGLTDSSSLGRAIPRILSGKTVRVLGSPDVAHSWTYVPDVARALVTLGTEPRAWGHAWHVPTAPPQTQREMITAFAEVATVDPPNVTSVPSAAVLMAGLVSPTVRAVRDVAYQFDRPFIIDSSKFTRTFGVTATNTREALLETYTAWTAPSMA
jgi:nucleoside-diphosphate-sugar epimerase